MDFFKQFPLPYVIFGAIIAEIGWIAFYLLTIDRWLRKIIGRRYNISIKPQSIALNSWYGWSIVDQRNENWWENRLIELLGSIIFVPVVFLPPIIVAFLLLR